MSTATFFSYVFLRGKFGAQDETNPRRTGSNGKARKASLEATRAQIEVTKTDGLARRWEVEVKRSRGQDEV